MFNNKTIYLMKLSRIFASLIAMTVLFVSCEKQNVGPEPGSPKSVTVSISNVSFTKSINQDLNLQGNKVALNNARILFTDGAAFYPAKKADGTDAVTYITDFTNPSLDFHLLDNRVNRVIIVGNMGESFNPANLDELRAAVLDVKDNQNPKSLPLYGTSTLTAGQPTMESAHGSTSWVAHVSLAPRISRIEIAGLACNFDIQKYSKIAINQIALSNFYYNHSFVSTAAPSNLFKIDNTAAAITNNFATNVANGANWYWDNPNVTLTMPVGGGLASDELKTQLAYNIFCPIEDNLTATSDGYARIDIQLVGTDALGTESPLYLSSNGFKTTTSGEPMLTSFEPGKIYRMAPLQFDESDLEHHLKCVSLSVEVIEWSVVAVSPVW